MILDGVKLSVGDSVHDIVHGSGKVVSTDENTADVTFTSGITQPYSTGGINTQRRRRTLYLAIPIIFAVTNDSTYNRRLRDTLTAVATALNETRTI